LARKKIAEKRELEDPKPLREKFMSWEEYHEKYPLWDFKQYIEDKIEFERIPPKPVEIPKEIRSRGYDFWHPTEKDRARASSLRFTFLPSSKLDHQITWGYKVSSSTIQCLAC